MPCEATRELFKDIMPLIADWDLTDRKQRKQTMVQFLGYQAKARLNAHHDLVGGFCKSMILVALHDVIYISI